MQPYRPIASTLNVDAGLTTRVGAQQGAILATDLDPFLARLSGRVLARDDYRFTKTRSAELPLCLECPDPAAKFCKIDINAGKTAAPTGGLAETVVTADSESNDISGWGPSGNVNLMLLESAAFSEVVQAGAGRVLG